MKTNIITLAPCGNTLTANTITRHLYRHFSLSHPVRHHPRGGIEVWVPSSSHPPRRTTLYDRFTVSPRHRTISTGWELLVTYNGTVPVYDTPVSLLDLKTDEVSVLADNEILRYPLLTPQQKQKINRAYPVVCPPLSRELGIRQPYRDRKNRYATAFNKITRFVSTQLAGTLSRCTVLQLQDALASISPSATETLPEAPSRLTFAHGIRKADPIEGLFTSHTLSGPALPSPLPKVRFFFIFRHKDAPLCRRLKNILRTGRSRPNSPKLFPAMGETIKQPLNTLRGKDIIFRLDTRDTENLPQNTQNALAQICRQLTVCGIGSDTTPVAVLINPLRADDPRDTAPQLQHLLAEALLHKHILLQSVRAERITRATHGNTLADLHTAILAKTGGHPWTAGQVTLPDDILIGAGAFPDPTAPQNRTITVCNFTPQGIFRECDRFIALHTDRLVYHIRKAMRHQLAQGMTPRRIILHSRNAVSPSQAQAIARMLAGTMFDTTLYVVRISPTDTHAPLAFDTSDKRRMPRNGTYVTLRKGRYILFNNSRNAHRTAYRTQFPIQVSITKYAKATAERPLAPTDDEARELLLQINKLSRLYWKTVRQPSLPVTVLYPQLIARAIHRFRQNAIPDFGTDKLWFL